MKTKNQKIEKHSNVALCFGRLAMEFERKISQMKLTIARRHDNPHPKLDEKIQMDEWQKYATEYRDEQRRHLLAMKVCGNEFVQIR